MALPEARFDTSKEHSIFFAIDRGGTFTDCFCEYPVHPEDVAQYGLIHRHVMKLLSVNPSSYPDAPREAIRRILEHLLQQPIPLDTPIPANLTNYIGAVRMGTTVATNALLERNGTRTALVVTAGLEGLIEIGTQARPHIFDLFTRKPASLAEVVVGACERVRVVPAADTCLTVEDWTPEDQCVEVLSEGGARVEVLRALDENKVKRDLTAVYARGIRSLAVALAHAYAYPEHERRVGAIARVLGFTHVTLSHEINVEPKLLPRALTACADAYLTPTIQQYLQQFLSGFEHREKVLAHTMFMQSDGTLTKAAEFRGFRAVLSGPAGGVIGYAKTAYFRKHGAQGHNSAPASENDAAVQVDVPAEGDALGDEVGVEVTSVDDAVDGDVHASLVSSLVGFERPVLGFDMGGTSTDVSRFAGSAALLYECHTAGILLQAPQLDISTVAAGGGSVLTFHDGIMHVGPRSASAHPGPACYGNDGPATVTDANVVCGRIVPALFPAVFGPRQDQPLDVAAAWRSFEHLAAKVNLWRQERGLPAVSVPAVALGYLEVAEEAMARPMRALTEARGHEARAHVLAAFGAAGGQHACGVSDKLGVGVSHVHAFASVLSAYGIHCADVAGDASHLLAQRLSPDACAEMKRACGAWVCESLRQLRASGYVGRRVALSVDAHVKYEGTDSVVTVHVGDVLGVAAHVPEELVSALFSAIDKGSDQLSHLCAALLTATTEVVCTADTGACTCASCVVRARMERLYLREYGFTLPERAIVLDVVRVRAVGHADAARAGSGGSDAGAGAGGELPAPLLWSDMWVAGDTQGNGAAEGEEKGTDGGASVLCSRARAVAGMNDGGNKSSTLGATGLDFAADGTARGRGAPTVDADEDEGVGHGAGRVTAEAGVRRVRAPVYAIASLRSGVIVPGPAIVADRNSTVVVLPGWVCVRMRDALLLLSLEGTDRTVLDSMGGAWSVPALARVLATRSLTATHASGPLCPGAAKSASASTVPSSSASPCGCPDTCPGFSLPFLCRRHPCSPLSLSLYSHRFMSIAEQMGRVLQRTAVSANIKERLDFSCALFSADGGLVANAPHLPVHLGAMQAAVRAQITHISEQQQRQAAEGSSEDPDSPWSRIGWEEGDVLISNHPDMGGSHLPDITVISPVFLVGCREPVFFVASRGHHADIGGVTPGSMPPYSTALAEEGCAIRSLLLVRGGRVNRAGLQEALRVGQPLGTRRYADNESDLLAQAAANQRGAALLKRSMAKHGAGELLAHMVHVQEAAGESVREMLITHALTERERQRRAPKAPALQPPPVPAGVAADTVQNPVTPGTAFSDQAVLDMLETDGPCASPSAVPAAAEEASADSSVVRFPRVVDYMDDGSPIALQLTVDVRTGEAIFDFEGTGYAVLGNTNSPTAVVLSAIIYVLRSLVNRAIPLNQGCLAGITVRFPPKSLLHPGPRAAVVAGNVLTSQRITDVVLQAIGGVCASSNGCMGNLTFGDDRVAYYETIGGGAGAAKGVNGASGVHVHMTNTRITDIESLERKFPVLVRTFTIRAGSGGHGAWRGGDGVVRVLRACRKLQFHLLTERRARAPRGARGGQSAATGRNLLVRAGTAGEREVVSVGARASLWLEPGDEVVVMTPGGGGYGHVDPCTCEKTDDDAVCACILASRKRLVCEDAELASAVAAQRHAAEQSRAVHATEAATAEEASGVAAPVRLTGGSVNQWALDQEQV